MKLRCVSVEVVGLLFLSKQKHILRGDCFVASLNATNMSMRVILAHSMRVK